MSEKITHTALKLAPRPATAQPTAWSWRRAVPLALVVAVAAVNERAHLFDPALGFAARWLAYAALMLLSLWIARLVVADGAGRAQLLRTAAVNVATLALVLVGGHLAVAGALWAAGGRPCLAFMVPAAVLNYDLGQCK